MMAFKNDFNWPRCTRGRDGDAHRIKASFHYTHEHPQYTCYDCWARFTPLERVDKRDSYIKKVIRFFRWKTQMNKPNWDKLIALMLMDMMRSEFEDEMVGTVDRDLPYEYQMDRVKDVK